MEATKKPTPSAIIATSSMTDYLSKASQAPETVLCVCYVGAGWATLIQINQRAFIRTTIAIAHARSRLGHALFSARGGICRRTNASPDVKIRDAKIVPRIRKP